jgi:hypothetical protein
MKKVATLAVLGVPAMALAQTTTDLSTLLSNLTGNLGTLALPALIFGGLVLWFVWRWFKGDD